MLLTEQELEASSKMDPSVAEYMQNNPSPPIDWNDYQGFRNILAMVKQMTAEALGPPNPAVLTEETIQIPLRDGFQSNLKITKPVNPPAAGAPLVVFAFGGGFIAGDEDQGTPLARMLTSAFGAVVVLIAYRLAPEHKFPDSHLDAWDSVKWIASNAAKLGADPSQGFIMSGISAGGCIASAVVTKAIEEPLAHPFTGQYLGSPTLLDPEHTPEKYLKYHLSLKHNVGTPILGAESMDSIQRHTEADLSSPWRFPINSSAPLSKQPKAFIMANGMDPLRDDALIWDEILKDNGVESRIKFYPGCPHVHWAFLPGIEISNKAIIDQIQGVGWLLGKEPTVEEVVKKCF